MGSALSLMPETPSAPPPPGAVFDGKIARLDPLTVTIDAYDERHEWEPCVWIGRGDPPERGSAVVVIRSDQETYWIAGDVAAAPIDVDALATAVLDRMWSTGDVRHTLRVTAAAGWLIASGQAITTANPDLRALLLAQSSPWGTSSGDPKLPDFRGRALIGVGTGPGLTARSLGDLVGTETHALTTAQLATHQHAVRMAGDGSIVAGNLQLGSSGNTFSFQSAGSNGGTSPGDGLSTSAGSGAAHPNTQPSAAVNIEVKT